MKPLPDSLKQLVGQRVASVETPALVVDLDAMERNLTRMADFAKKHNVRLRPHAKMHKSAALAKLQMQAGAVGVCVQKTSEAEILADKGVHNIYISNEVVSLSKLERVAKLARWLMEQNGKLSIAVDSLEGVDRLAAALEDAPQACIDVFIEIDVGQGRCGVARPQAALTLAQHVLQHSALHFAGLQAYHGKAQHLRTAAERREAIGRAVQDVVRVRSTLEAAGIAVDLITGAGSGSFMLEAASGVYGELQAGSYLFMDADYAANERDPAQPAFEHALFVKAQVMSKSASHAVCDAGHKSHAIDSGLPKVHLLTGGDDVAQAFSALEYSNGGDEHGILRGARLPALGATVWLVPGHCDPTVNLHDFMVGVRGGLEKGVVERIIRVDTRGALT